MGRIDRSAEPPVSEGFESEELESEQPSPINAAASAERVSTDLMGSNLHASRVAAG